MVAAIFDLAVMPFVTVWYTSITVIFNVGDTKTKFERGIPPSSN